MRLFGAYTSFRTAPRSSPSSSFVCSLSASRSSMMAPDAVTCPHVWGIALLQEAFAISVVVQLLGRVGRLPCQAPSPHPQAWIPHRVVPECSKCQCVCSACGCEELYPAILQELGLPDDHHVLHFMIDAMEYIGQELECCTLWLETELLMRNPAKIKESYDSLHTLHSRHGLPPPVVCFRTLTIVSGGARGTERPFEELEGSVAAPPTSCSAESDATLQVCRRPCTEDGRWWPQRVRPWPVVMRQLWPIGLCWGIGVQMRCVPADLSLAFSDFSRHGS